MKRNTIVLAGTLVLLIAVAYLVMQKPGEQSVSSASSGFLLKIDSLAVDKIEIKQPSGKVVMEKRGVEWFVQSPVQYKADQANIVNTIHQIKILEGKGVVSGNPDKYSLFQVDSSGTLVTVYEKGTEKASLIIGKTSSSYTETFVRVGKSSDVVLVEGVFGYMFNRSLKEWRDKTILNTPKETIKEVKFQFGDTTFVLALKDSVWMIGKDSTLESSVSALLGSLSSIQTDDFIDSTITPAPKIIAQISFNGTQLRFAFSKETTRYLVQSSLSPQWFVLDTWKANQLLKRKKELVKTRK